MSVRKAVSITVHGKVQGVGFRYFVKSFALRHGLTGYVKNISDGTVYIEAEGEEHILRELIEKCKQGPILSQVKEVLVAENMIINYTDFKINK